MTPPDLLTKLALEAAERGWIPDSLLRLAIRRICSERLAEVDGDPETTARLTREFLQRTGSGPIAVHSEAANAQHYEVPPVFFDLMLGPTKKYSCCYWEEEHTTLAQAEQAALARTCQNAGLEDRQKILELGCGWGSLSLYMAESYPNSEILAVSNSSSQRQFITDEAARRKLDNLQVATADINDFEPPGRVHRVVSVEMFEHLRNHRLLLERIASWLEPEGELLVHIFCTRGAPYLYEDQGANDWMARNFFSGGVMPSDDLLLRYQQHLRCREQWRWSGTHYQRTLEAWLDRLDTHATQAASLFANLGDPQPQRAVQRWRMFLLACSELFGSRQGRDWWVSHYRFSKR